MTAEQRARDEVGVTEDDIMEIRQDISTLRYELIDILHNNGMKTPRVNIQDATGKISTLFPLKSLSVLLIYEEIFHYKQNYIFFFSVW